MNNRTADSAGAGTSPTLDELFSRPPVISGGIRRISYSTDQIDIREQVAAALQEAGTIADPFPLETFHQRAVPEHVLPLQELLHQPSVKTHPGVREQYHRLVRFLAREILGFDVVFEANPFIRFHVPATMPLRYRSREGLLISHHNDILVGDPFEQINCWIPLTRCRGTAAFHMSTLEESRPLLRQFAQAYGLDATTFIGSRPQFYELLATNQAYQHEVVSRCLPLEIDYGELVMFDARVLHATTENFEDITRISIDFRLIPIPVYERRAAQFRETAQAAMTGLAPLKGQFYDERTAYQL